MLKVDCSNYHGGAPGGSSSSRRSSVARAAKQDEDDRESLSSELPSNCFGFVAYSVNPGEKSRVKVKTTSHQHASWCETDRIVTPLPSHAASPGPIPSPRETPSPVKLRTMFQQEPDTEDRQERHSKKRKYRDGNFNDQLDLLWLG